MSATTTLAPTATAASADEVIERARQLAASGTTRDEAATQLSRAVDGERAVLEAAHLRWLDRMHRLASDDPTATPVLRLLQAALARTPRPPYAGFTGPG